MTTDEKLMLTDRADVWMEKYPELQASVTSWEDAPVKDFDEGLILCSCLRQARSFVEAAYQFNAKKSLTMIEGIIKEIIRLANPGGPRTEEEKKTKKVKAFVPKTPAPDENGRVNLLTEADRIRLQEEAMVEEEKNDKWRPQGLDGYIHLLTKDTQQECRNVQRKFYMPLREYRTRLESLVENPDATDEQRKEMANNLVLAEDALAAFWAKVDLEYKKMTGQEIPTEPVKEKKLSEFTKEDIDKVEDGEQKEQLKKNRIENNKKYLRRDDLQVCDEVREQLLLRVREMDEWGVKLSNKQLDNLQKHGIKIEPKAEKPAEGTEAKPEGAAPAEQVEAPKAPEEQTKDAEEITSVDQAQEPAAPAEQPDTKAPEQNPNETLATAERNLFNQEG